MFIVVESIVGTRGKRKAGRCQQRRLVYGAFSLPCRAYSANGGNPAGGTSGSEGDENFPPFFRNDRQVVATDGVEWTSRAGPRGYDGDVKATVCGGGGLWLHTDNWNTFLSEDLVSWHLSSNGTSSQALIHAFGEFIGMGWRNVFGAGVSQLGILARDQRLGLALRRSFQVLAAPTQPNTGPARVIVASDP